MRFNEKELVSLSRQPPEKAAELGMRGPKKGDGNITLSHQVQSLVSFLVKVQFPILVTFIISCSCEEAVGETGRQLPVLFPDR